MNTLSVTRAHGGIAWIGSHELDPARPLRSAVRPLEVQVISLDWKWLFIYPEQGVASSRRACMSYRASAPTTPTYRLVSLLTATASPTGEVRAESSAAVGSSASTSSGSPIRARAMPTRWR